MRKQRERRSAHGEQLEDQKYAKLWTLPFLCTLLAKLLDIYTSNVFLER
jgi:hypothetical protein